MRILGIDEAGRGCVLGALFVGAFVHEGDPEALRAVGVRDSKRLSAKKRTTIRAALDDLGTPDLRLVTANAIDDGNLNALEEEAIVDLVRTHRPDRVELDALGHPKTLPALMERLDTALAGEGLDIEWVIEPKADGTWPTCGAASIVAKTARDAALEELAATWGALGSGYPSDPVTRAWLTAHAASGAPWPDFVRTRWGTITDIAQQVMFGA